jgi:hypothetical protein
MNAADRDFAEECLAAMSTRAATVTTALRAAVVASREDRDELLQRAMELALRAQSSLEQRAAQLQRLVITI